MRRMRPLRLALSYAVIAVLWITISDRALVWMGLSNEVLVRYSLAKGFGFVAVTTLSLYVLANNFAKATERREREYRHLFEHNPNPMWFYDLETLAFLRVNDAAIAKYGYSAEEFAEMTIADIRPSEDLDRLHANVEAVRSGAAADVSEAGAWRHVTKDGRLLWVDITSHVVEFEGRPAEAVVVRDMTEAHEARQELFRLRRETLLRERSTPADGIVTSEA